MAFLGPNAEILPILSSSPNGTVVSSTCGTPIAFDGEKTLNPVDVVLDPASEPVEFLKTKKYFSELNSDIVIKALGFDPENLPKLFNSKDLQITRWGTLKTDFDTMETNLPGVFAAGDIVRGASLVVWAIKDGRDAATSIKNFLENKEAKRTKVA